MALHMQASEHDLRHPPAVRSSELRTHAVSSSTHNRVTAYKPRAEVHGPSTEASAKTIDIGTNGQQGDGDLDGQPPHDEHPAWLHDPDAPTDF